jgi:formylmethanofuran dehydrogenase subunit E
MYLADLLWDVRVGTPTREELLDRCVEFHGHLCLGQVLGLRLALLGMELVGTRDPKEMIVFIENDRCISDAIQLITGTRIGRRSAKLIDYGKMAATFVNTQSGNAYRVNVRHIDPNARHSKEAIRQVLHTPDAELLKWQRVAVFLKPEDFPGKPRRTANCARCGEKVFDGKEVQGDAGPLCLPCAQGPYYEIVEEGE